MKNEVRIVAVLIGFLIVIGVIWVSWNTGLSGSVANLKDKTIDLNLKLNTPNETLLEESITLSATADKQLVSVKFEATNGGCTQMIGEDTESPYELSWTPSCGEGTYTVSATALHASGKTQTKKATVSVTHKLIETILYTNTFSGGPITTSATAYPPNVGSAPNQRLVSVTLGPAETNVEVISIDGSITMHKSSGGTFNGQYRILDTTSGKTLHEATITNPTEAITDTFNTQITLSEGESANIQLQIRSSEDFSAITADSFSVTVVHTGLR